jgi:hypothetical protein
MVYIISTHKVKFDDLFRGRTLIGESERFNPPSTECVFTRVEWSGDIDLTPPLA